MARRKPGNVKSLTADFFKQPDLGAADPRYNQGGERQSEAYPSQRPAAAPRKPVQAQRPKTRQADRPAPKARPTGPLPMPGSNQPDMDKLAPDQPFGIPPGLQVGQEPYSDRYPSGFGSLPGPPDLPGPLNLPPPPPGVSGLTPSVNYPPDLQYGGGPPAPQFPATQPNVPMGGVAQPPAAMNTLPRAGISSPSAMPVPPPPTPMDPGPVGGPGRGWGTSAGAPPPQGLLDSLSEYLAGMKRGFMGGQ